VDEEDEDEFEQGAQLFFPDSHHNHCLNNSKIRSLLAERWRKRKMSIDELPTIHVLIGGTVNYTIKT